MAAGPLIEELVAELDLTTHLRAEGPEGEDRIENVRELIAGAMEFDAGDVDLDDEVELAAGVGVGAEGRQIEPVSRLTDLDHFLQQVALITDIDRADPNSDAVLFMTLHNAKGLEFPSVFLSGLEDGLFPLGRAYDEPAQLEEERRLMYVGITRAEDRLSLSWARERRRGGDLMVGRLSSFVEDIPAALLIRRRSPVLERRNQEYASRSRSGAEISGSPSGGLRRGGSGEFGARLESRRKEVREPVFDETMMLGDDLNQDLPRMVRGERVVHGTFGSGTVVEVTGTGRDVKIVVDFRSVGRKKLLAAYAGLEKDF
jgi:DNA helicase-2/ATP-dependent DNA helicase PcrA